MALMYDMETVNKTMQAATSLVAKDITPRERWILNQFAAMKPVEAEPVVHARWIPVWKNLFSVKYCKCSACGCKEKDNSSAYCHCGARMDGGAADAPR